MTHILRLATLALVAGLLPSSAQDTGRFSAAASAAFGAASMRDLTGASTGVALEAAWDAPASIGPIRIGLSLSRFGAGQHSVGFRDAEDNPFQMSLSGPSLMTRQAYVSAKAVVAEKLDLHFGVSLNWHRLGAGYPEQSGHRPEGGTKLGLRSTLAYALTPMISLEGTFQWVEVARAPDASHLHTPSWFQVGARWHF